MFLSCQMFLTMDALADGGVWAGIPKELSLKLVAHTMFVSSITHTVCCIGTF